MNTTKTHPRDAAVIALRSLQPDVAAYLAGHPDALLDALREVHAGFEHRAALTRERDELSVQLAAARDQLAAVEGRLTKTKRGPFRSRLADLQDEDKTIAARDDLASKVSALSETIAYIDRQLA